MNFGNYLNIRIGWINMKSHKLITIGLVLLLVVCFIFPADARVVRDDYSIEAVTALKEKVENQAAEIVSIERKLAIERQHQATMQERLGEELSGENDSDFISYYEEQIRLTTKIIEELKVRYRQLNEQYSIDTADYCQRCIVLIDRGEMDELAARYANALTQSARLATSIVINTLEEAGVIAEGNKSEDTQLELAARFPEISSEAETKTTSVLSLLGNRLAEFKLWLKENTDNEGRLFLVPTAEEFGLEIPQLEAILRELAEQGVVKELFGKFDNEYLDVVMKDEETGMLIGSEFDTELYVKLRGKVHTDTEGTWHVVGRTLFILDGKIVLQIKGSEEEKEGYMSGKLEILSGHLGVGLSLREGTFQEIKEETGLKEVDANRFITVSRGYLAIGTPDTQTSYWDGDIFRFHTDAPVYNYEFSGLFIYKLTQSEFAKIQESLSDPNRTDKEVAGLEVWDFDDLLRELERNPERFDDNIKQYLTDPDTMILDDIREELVESE